MDMTNSAIVMGLTIYFVEIFKARIPKEKEEMAKRIMPGIIVAVATFINIIGACIGWGCSAEVIKAAAYEGIRLSIVASGLYGLGKSTLGKS